ncbi:MAG TPA: autotransporter-associated beta strand repeat-containing protein, partial [Tepidisphaeraceae bacterium]|nr:autotransporter-associated beta strand repeat-containing protein [Tepidisphaeraceae bacterium]
MAAVLGAATIISGMGSHRAVATTYTYGNETVDLSLISYTSDDVLNLSTTTLLNASAAGIVVPSSINLGSGTTVTGSGDITFSGAVSGSGLTKTGTAVLAISGSNPNLLSSITVSGGTLRLGNLAALGSSSSSSLFLNTGGTLDLNGTTTPRSLNLNGGAIINDNLSADSTLSQSLFGSSILLGGAGGLTLTGNISPGTSFTKFGAGTVTLTNPSNSISSAIAVNGGTLRAGAAGALGSSPSMVTLNATGEFDLNGLSIAKSFTFAGGALANENTSTPVAITSTSGWSVTAGNNYILGGAGDLTLNTSLFASTLVKTGAGILTIASSTSISSLMVNAGTLRVTTSPTSAAITVNSGATFDLFGMTTIPHLTLNGSSLVNSDTVHPVTVGSGSNITYAGPQIYLGGAGDMTLGAFVSYSQAMIKIGTGTLTISTSLNPATFAVNAGTLRMGSSGFINASSISINPNASFDLFGSTTILPSHLVFAGGALVNNDTVHPVNFSGSGLTVSGSVLPVGGAGDMSFSASLSPSQTVALTKIGAGMLTLSGSHTGSTVLRGGTVAISSGFSLGNGTTAFDGGTLRNTLSTSTGSQAFTISANGGTFETLADFSIFGALTGVGPLTKTGTAKLQLEGNTIASVGAVMVSAGTLVVDQSQGLICTSLAIAPGAFLDVRGNPFVLDYSGASPVDSVRQYLLSGRDNGAWDGSGINSLNISSAFPEFGLGYIEASQRFGLTGGQTAMWFGQTVDATAVLVKETLYGDANMDGVVNSDDYALLDRGMAKHLTGWSNGDFNYDGVIDAGDYLLMDESYVYTHGAPSPEMLSDRESRFGAGYVSALMASVPEPTLLSIAVVMAGVRRRR